jgi:uncharacterized lipoprotein YmbA
MNIRPSSWGAALLVSAALAGCQSAPTKIYTLMPVAARAARSDYSGPPVRLDAVHVPPSLNRVELMSMSAPGELTVYDTAHWSAPLNQATRQTLSEDLIARLPEGKVIFPHLSKPQGALGITVDLIAVNIGSTGAVLQASWSVDGSSDGMSHGGAARLTAEPAADPAAIARSFSALLGQLADRIAATL